MVTFELQRVTDEYKKNYLRKEGLTNTSRGKSN